MPSNVEKTGAPSVLKLRAPAKVNLFLKVLSKRPDGYHEILTLMQAVSLFDEIFIEVCAGEGIEAECAHPQAPGGRDNLAYRAAELFLREAGLRRAVRIRIEKNIPVGAGLGGGSSDAAAVLKGLNKALSSPLDTVKLKEIGARIGSDVPFFITGRAALASGRGERLKEVSMPRFTYLLINPGFHVSTAWAYSNLDLTKKPQDYILTYSEEAFAKGLEAEKVIEMLSNDLEAVTIKRHPEIALLKTALMESGASGALMSGSGPTVFGVYPGRQMAGKALESLKKDLVPGCSVFLAEGL